MYRLKQQSGGRRFFAGLVLGMLFLTLQLVFGAAAVQAAKKNGFVTEGGKTYYYINGVKHKGWLELDGKKYYFTSGQGVMLTGWVKDSRGNRRFFHKETGVMYTGWVQYSGGKRYFNEKSGIMKTGWILIGSNRYYLDTNTGFAKAGFFKDSAGKVRYFYSKSCAMARGWLTNSKNEKRYFASAKKLVNDGVMATKFSTIDRKTYYFYSNSGKMATGWVTNTKKGYKYYFDPNTGVMATGIVSINGVKYEFADDGILIGEYSSMPSTTTNGKKTIKNYLLGALLPVGKVLYIWGGGYNYSDQTRKGLSETWTKWYKSQPSSYNYLNYSDLSTTNRAKGLDCSGFVGWAAYQVMQTRSGVGGGYTVVSGDIGNQYQNRLGWGTIINQNYLSAHDWVLKPGDIGYNSGHTWIVLGQCRDKSVVIVHSTTNAGVQIAGTAVPTTGNTNSQAAELAKKYMSRYSGTKKFTYYPSVGNYIRQYNFIRWNRSTLADPEGYMNKTADQILADLFRG